MTTASNRLDYYFGLAEKTGQDLANIIRNKNSFKIAPITASELVMMPVYETGQVSLLSYTNEQVETTVRYINARALFIDAYFMRMNSGTPRNIITLTSDSNYCWSRFLVCKELMHSYFYDTGEEVEKEAMTSSFAGLQELVEEILVPDPEMKPQAYADLAAFASAINYLMPSDTLPLINAIFDELNTRSPDPAYRTVAQLIRVPEVVVKKRLDQYRQAKVVVS